MSRKRIVITGTVIVLSLFVATPAFAATAVSNVQNKNYSAIHWSPSNNSGPKKPFQPVEIGTVSRVIGNNITLSVKKSTTTSTYTVDASNATLIKGSNAIKTDDIQIGDTLIVRGAVSGSTVAASQIIDDIPQTKPSFVI